MSLQKSQIRTLDRGQRGEGEREGYQIAGFTDIVVITGISYNWVIDSIILVAWQHDKDWLYNLPLAFPLHRNTSSTSHHECSYGKHT